MVPEDARHEIDDFIQGIEEMDRVAREIEITIPRLMEWVKKWHKSPQGKGVVSISGGTDTHTWCIDFLDRNTFGLCSRGRKLYSTRDGYHQPGANDVIRIRRILPSLWDVLNERLPHLAIVTKPYLNAAKVQEYSR